LPSGLVHPWMDVPSAPEMDSTESDQAGVARTAARSCGGMTRIERDFDPEAVRQMKATAGRDITVAGPGPAAQAVEAGCVDECHLFVTPIVVEAAEAPPDHVRLELERRTNAIGNGVVHLHYRSRT
jgi:dihydrofolate reductase